MAATAGGLVAVAVLYLWDDLFWAAPVVAVSRRVGPLWAFVVFTLLYGWGSFVISLWIVRVHDARSGGRSSRLARWLDRQEQRARTRRTVRMLAAGRALGFVLSSWLLGAIVTTWLLLHLDRRRNITARSALSSAIFAVTFVGSYVGIFEALRRVWPTSTP